MNFRFTNIISIKSFITINMLIGCTSNILIIYFQLCFTSLKIYISETIPGVMAFSITQLTYSVLTITLNMGDSTTIQSMFQTNYLGFPLFQYMLYYYLRKWFSSNLSSFGWICMEIWKFCYGLSCTFSIHSKILFSSFHNKKCSECLCSRGVYCSISGGILPPENYWIFFVLGRIYVWKMTRITQKWWKSVTIINYINV